ncbi:YciI family protein [Paenibacillus hexagrammi]|uniref:YciI family protein n=1 Tax=Paenibacillus hexagrammi TaxID=2908839 RepID=A0ABY3SN37_9BACL|nr:YciI family protein [Paenibacillus sp. YPD9-1]UJF35452.1 YciI family protein [Paenibacillus sp. YPD9-1]
MFLVMLTYKVPIEEVERHLESHGTYLDQQYAAKRFICSGRKVPRTGGVILANVPAREELDRILSQDPFYQHDIAEYEIIEFQPTKYDERFQAFIP